MSHDKHDSERWIFWKISLIVMGLRLPESVTMEDNTTRIMVADLVGRQCTCLLNNTVILIKNISTNSRIRTSLTKREGKTLHESFKNLKLTVHFRSTQHVLNSKLNLHLLTIE